MSEDATAAPTSRAAFGIGVATSSDDVLLDVRYLRLGLGWQADVMHQLNIAEPGILEVPHDLAASLSPGLPQNRTDARRGVRLHAVATHVADLDQPPANPFDAYLRLHLLSHRLIKPRTANLDGVFSLLATVVWTNFGPCAVDNFEHIRGRLPEGLIVHGVDKFPRMVDYVVPSGVRIAVAERVRLGAHLAAGTTVMHEGFVNFNAGTLGTSMVEGRISAGVTVGDGSDIGGGASIMGTLSGGGSEVISIGEHCLVGANAGVGISLGDDCTVEAGLYVTAGTKALLPDGSVVKARDLSGRSNLLFRRNSTTGVVEAVARSGSWQGLNQVLHNN